MEWIDGISSERYRPMMRLLADEEFEFLRSQAMRPRQIARIRARRCRIFRGYLRSLDADFARVCLAVKFLIAESQEDRADLARVLLRQQARFGTAMLRVQFRLLMYNCGLGSVDVSALVGLFDGMRRQMMTLAPAAV